MKDLFKKFIDDEFDNWMAKQNPGTSQPEQPEEKKPKREDGKKVVRTKGTGDKVYLLDPETKTKAWVSTEEVLTQLGFGMDDVETIEDSEFIEYQTVQSIFKVNE